MKKLLLILIFGIIFLSMVGSVSANWGGTGIIVDSHNIPFPTTDSVNTKQGFKIIANINSTLLNVTKDSAVTASTAYLLDSSASIIQSSSFVGNDASFNSSLIAGTTYYVVVDNLGSSYTRALKSSGIAYPYSGININWTGGYANGDTPTEVYIITNITTDTGGSIILDNPTNSYITSSNQINFSCSVQSGSGTTISNISLWTNGTGIWSRNQTKTVSGYSNFSNFTSTFSMEGNYLWTCSATDSNNDEGFSLENRTFTIDQTYPTISILNPTTTINYGYQIKNVSLNYSIFDTNINSCWYNYNDTSTNITIPCSSNTTFLLGNYGNRSLTIYANDSVGNENSSTINWDYNIFESNVSFINETVEGSQETFQLNLTLKSGLSLTNSSLIYNGTEYSTTIDFLGGIYSISSTINIPLVSVDSVLFFNFNFTVDGTEYSSRINNQTVLDLQLSVCGVSSNDVLLNMSLVDEVLRSPIFGNIEIGGEIINKISGQVVETVNQGFNNVTSASICFSPVSSYNLYYFDSTIKYSSTGFVSEFYIIQKADLGNYPLNLTLYDLNSSSSTQFLIKYQGENLIAVEGAVIQLLRKYISNGTYEVVESPITSNIGTSIVHVDLDTNEYKIIVVKDGVVLDTFTNLVFNCESPLTGQCTQNLFGSIDSQNFIDTYILEDFSILISEVNETITTTFSIPSGTSSQINVQLKQVDMFGNESLCNKTIYSSAGSVDCTYNNTIGDSIVYLEVYKDGILEFQRGYFIKEAGSIDWLGNNFFIAFIILLSLVGIAISSPEWIVLISIITFVFFGGVFLLNGLEFMVGLEGIIWLIVGGIIIIYKMTTQEDK